MKQRLGLYGDLGVSPESLTLSPVAIYNAMEFDQSLEGRKGPVIFLDIGTQATDVVIADSGRCWIRTFPLGGTHFTEAIANAFKRQPQHIETYRDVADRRRRKCCDLFRHC